MPRGHSCIGMAIANCAAAIPFTMAETGAVQIRSQLAVESLSSSSGQPWQSGIDIAPSADVAMSNAIAFALTACTTVLSANTARNTTAMSEANFRILRIYFRVYPMSIHDPVPTSTIESHNANRSHPAQHDSFATSLSKVCAASFNPSTVVR